ncbi:MAG: KpsF/GutQ family sugar-phosphate isomerase [Proteobacteria bacterium]|nr:KpsF/GutQ family sugar-phosphate isomerase [Pseudomonadota bacterium]MDA1323295.1 KpsF/GutQ family sugar-phosphate isomerase [Pseudomonadota bacterium]
MTTTKKSGSRQSDLDVARRVLAHEAAGLAALSAVLDDSFVKAVDLMEAAKGRVVVSGMGKSGNIAQKIAATLASTGTPAQYVNAAEASHGDLGMITLQDVVMTLSYSGETVELSDLVAFTRLMKIPLIAMSGRAGSSLDKAGDVSLVLPRMDEACPNNLAPTTSTTAMMALGDALAVALLERKGFSAEDFNALHPGGQLGRRFIKLSDIMHRGEAIPLARHDSQMSETLLTITAKSLGCVGVVGADGTLVGIITDGDLRRHMDNGLLERRASEIMTKSPLTVSPDMLAAAVLGLMNDRKITAMFAVEASKPVGIVHIHDLLRAGLV